MEGLGAIEDAKRKLRATYADLGTIYISQLRDSLTMQLRGWGRELNALAFRFRIEALNVGHTETELTCASRVLGRRDVQCQNGSARVELTPLWRLKSQLQFKLLNMELNSLVHVLDKLDGVREGGGHMKPPWAFRYGQYCIGSEGEQLSGA